MISIILPIYNEEKRLGKCLARITYYLNRTRMEAEILCVLNGCVDASGEIALSFARRWDRISILSLPTAGKGLAVRTGMLAARGEWRYMADVDLATPITELPRFISVARSRLSDIVIGKRAYQKSASLRSAAHIGFVQLARVFTGLEDTQCGFKLFTAEAAKRVFSQAREDGWAFDVEALFIAKRLGLKIIPLQVEWNNDKQDSKLSPVQDGIKMLGQVMKLASPGQ